MKANLKKTVGAVSLLAATAMTDLQAKTTSFIGCPDNADGALFSVASNWDNGLPTAGDYVVVSSLVECVTNDLPEDTSFARFSLYRNTAVSFAPKVFGSRIRLTNRLVIYDGSEIHVEIVSPSGFTLQGGDNSRICAPLTVEGGTLRYYIDNAGYVEFHAPVIVNGTLTGNGNEAYRHGSLKFFDKGNYFKKTRPWYGNLEFFADNAVDPEFVIDFGDSNKENNRGMYRFNGTDQTADRITNTLTRTSGCQIDGTGVLTLNGSADSVTTCLIQNSLSVVWNPSGDFVQVFSNRAHTTTGALTVSNGTLRVDAGASFKKVRSVTVADGATFDLASDVASSLAEVTSLSVDGVFAVSESAGNPFSGALPSASIGPSGKLRLAEGVVLDVTMLSVGGVYPPAGTYDSGSCSWIEGGGAVSVVNDNVASWAAAVSGNWSDVTKWTGQKVPAAGISAYLTAAGADYDVVFDVPSIVPASITVGGRGGISKLSFPSAVAFAESGANTFNVGDGGTVEFSGGVASLTNSSGSVVSVTGSGVWRVAGATNEIYTGGWGGFKLKDGGTLEVAEGRFLVKNTKFSYANGISMSDGNIKISGNGYFESVNSQGEFNPLGSGEVDISGSGVMYLRRAFVGPNRAGVPLHVVTSDRGVLESNAGVFFGDTLSGGVTHIELSGASDNDFGWQTGIGVNRSCFVRLDINAGAKVEVGGYGSVIGGMVTKKHLETCCPTGIVNVSGGEFSPGGYYYGQSGFGGANQYQGVIVGGIYDAYLSESYSSATLYSKNVDHRFHGELHVRNGGRYDQGDGYFAVGMASADGIVTVENGTVNKAAGGEIFIGALGGCGSLTVGEGGSVNFEDDVYIGGFDPSALSIPRTYSGVIRAPASSTGRVDVASGSFETGGRIVVGADGAGRLEVGPGGDITAGALVLSNSVSSALVFRFDASGTGTISLSGALTVTDGAELVVDASACSGGRGRFRLLSAASVEGEFRPDKITVKGPKGFWCRLDDRGIVAGTVKGTCILVR